ncbi:hypothetical protein ACWEQL_21195 [Kitasatospora sp. NPDC004240]
MSLKEAAVPRQLTALVSEPRRGAQTRAGTHPRGSLGTIARDRPDAGDAQEDDPVASASAVTRLPLAAVNTPSPASGGPGGGSNDNGGRGSGGGNDDANDDDGDNDDDPPHSDGGDPTAMADQAIAMSGYLHTGLSVRLDNWAEAKVGIHSTESEGPQLLNITAVIILSTLVVAFVAYTGTHSASLPGGTAAKMIIIVGVSLAILAFGVYTISRHKPTGRTFDPDTKPGRHD